jgi:hypothetical protein
MAQSSRNAAGSIMINMVIPNILGAGTPTIDVNEARRILDVNSQAELEF